MSRLGIHVATVCRVHDRYLFTCALVDTTYSGSQVLDARAWWHRRPPTTPVDRLACYDLVPRICLGGLDNVIRLAVITTTAIMIQISVDYFSLLCLSYMHINGDDLLFAACCGTDRSIRPLIYRSVDWLVAIIDIQLRFIIIESFDNDQLIVVFRLYRVQTLAGRSIS